ncbi:hypothetical protein [Spirosoma fluminis]
MKRFWIRRGLRFLSFGLFFVGFAGFAVMALWNALLPDILGVSAITFWQALGLLVLSRLLFGGGRGFGPGRYGFQRGSHDWQGGPGRREWKQKMTERWQQMTPEQREQMKQQWGNRCSSWGRGRGVPPRPDQTEQNEPTADT